MIKENLYHKTVDILVQAYFNDELRHSDCFACAVGNITGNHNWFLIFRTIQTGCANNRDALHIGKEYTQILKNEDEFDNMDSCGYTYRQLAKIEWRFESAPKGNSDEDWMFNGLMAVVDVLDEIHENEAPEISQTAKNKFKKHAVYE